MVQNYYMQYRKEIEHIQQSGIRPRLLLHSCCAPCSSAVLEQLCIHFDVSIFYYNPNIQPAEEYEKRLCELKRLLTVMELPSPVGLVPAPYCPDDFLAITKGLEDQPERGERCRLCFRLRLGETARMCAQGGYDWFTSTLTISPYKNAVQVNEEGLRAAQENQVQFLPADFKKQNGYQRSIALSSQYGLYRQNTCGCVFSARQRQERRPK